MLQMQKCPRCSGDLYDERDQYGEYFACLQCGYLQEKPEVAARERHAESQSQAARDTLTIMQQTYM